MDMQAPQQLAKAAMVVAEMEAASSEVDVARCMAAQDAQATAALDTLLPALQSWNASSVRHTPYS